ncbi:hypothetical protein GCM10007916_26170 [Psychromonas marina]|uniref:EAL domain-containing protein n=1 Tax=Psychromonas marina TaxID=88364 RepID=A0ABQ6E2B0_9GAMM|nr:EAL domain-containing protein [Psychromonas marina]GLS91548.1 hypothetical protein GCM10007916_26170 [Psychromonas marina]
MGINSIDNKAVFSFKWYESLKFKIAALFLVLFFIIALSVMLILNTFAEKMIQDEAYLRLNNASSEVISELERHTILSSTLVDTMANLAEQLPYDSESYYALFPQVINYKGTEAFIAGGGIWPAPYEFNEEVERHSFFWARDKSGKLNFYNNYNEKMGMGYHHEEWYVPATHLLEGGVYWSKSYTDPYSLEPMVTVSAPITKAKKNIGVATIDLRLDGLQQLLTKVTKSFGGYAFAIDRNGTFLSYPEIEQVISTVKNRDGSELKSFVNYQDFSQQYPTFMPLSQLLDEQRQSLLSKLETNTRFGKKLSATIALNSYQISEEEANLIVASLFHSRSNANDETKRVNVQLKDDLLLHEPVFVSIRVMPDTYWKIITVMPYSQSVGAITATYKQLIFYTFIALLFTVFIIWLVIRHIVSSPISHLAQQVQYQVDDDHSPMKLFDTSAKGELKTLVEIFNQRTAQLLHSQKKVEKLAHFDALTGLPNRRMLINRINNKLAGYDRENCFGALLFIDIDNFKRINDSLGHDVGDQLLLRVAERFTQTVRKEDTVARLGGDEFVVLITKNYTFSKQLNYESTVVAQKLVEAMQAPISLNNQLHHMTISIGISVFPQQRNCSDELLRQADTAMYRVKAKGKNGYCFFNTEMQERAFRRVEIEQSLRVALDTNQLFLVYQPQVDNQGNCLGAEALVRWTHPDKGVLSPIEFISIAEECGLIIELGTWVIDAACAQFKTWSDNGNHLKKISVNVSPKQFRDINFVNIVRDAIKKHQINPKRLILEITEGIVIKDISDTIDKMTVLKSLGVRLSIDDFGTGYSSLRYLKELPLDQLKIDQSFVRDIINQPKDAMIVTTIISIANNLELNVIAEGVENKEQVTMLIDKGCMQFQGYYFSKPKTAADFTQYLEEQAIDNVHQFGIKPSTNS